MVDTLNISPVPVYGINHQILMFPKMDYTVFSGPQYAVITKFH